jgi:hypothetical protein
MTASETMRATLRASLTRRRQVMGLMGLGLALVLLWATGVLTVGVTTVRVLLVLNVGLAVLNIVLALWRD